MRNPAKQLERWRNMELDSRGSLRSFAPFIGQINVHQDFAYAEAYMSDPEIRYWPGTGLWVEMRSYVGS